MELQPHEAVALGQLGVSGGAGPALQEGTHLGAVGAAGCAGAGVGACEERRQRPGVSVSISALSVEGTWRGFRRISSPFKNDYSFKS